MSDNQNQINQLHDKLESLLKRQESFSIEVNEIKREIAQLKKADVEEPFAKEEILESKIISHPVEVKTGDSPKRLTRNIHKKIFGGICSGLADYFEISNFVMRFFWVILSLFYGVGIVIYVLLWISLPSAKSVIKKDIPLKLEPEQEKKAPLLTSPILKKTPNDLEKFIGENLISKIGIAILVLGVGVGVKYSIENDLISPLTRIILGYIVGLGLLVFGMQLKKKYTDFSAVLVSGAMAAMYFITYAAHSFYALFPQTTAFLIMVLFTAFTVFAAINYNNQIIALIGLVGAYAVPFLLSNGSGNITVFFSYMAIINIGILLVSFKKYWKMLYFSSFALTWLIYFSWFNSRYEMNEHFGLALTFLLLFFAIFYITFLAFKIIKKEEFEIPDILLLLANSFVFYGFGYVILDGNETGSQLLGVFTVGNGITHFITSTIIYKQKLGDKNLFYMVSGLVLVFITIAIPVQLDGNWVTLLWSGEAALLFWLGRTRQIPIYENISYPLMALATFSLYQDWTNVYHFYNHQGTVAKLNPIMNIQFLSSLLYLVAIGFIAKLNLNKKYNAVSTSMKEIQEMVSLFVPAILIITLYGAFFMEMTNYWNLRFSDSLLNIDGIGQIYNYDLRKFQTVWTINYSLFFVALLSFVNIKKIKSVQLGMVSLGLATIAMLLFLTQGLYTLSELRESYLHSNSGDYYKMDSYHILVRYISFVFVLITFLVSYSTIKQEFMKQNLKLAFDLALHMSVLWILSSELIHILNLSGSTQSYKLGLSILWGIYSTLLIVLGIWKQRPHLRAGAIALFSVTLLKLFFYDISHLNTISKTIVFVSLGVLLLIISFLYNKYKHLISDENEI